MRATQPLRTNRARALRSVATSAEELMWSALRNRRLGGLKFVRQATIGIYFADFVCREHHVIVEIDGGTHSLPEEIARDQQRSSNLRAQGYRIFRVHNEEIYQHLDEALDHPLAFAQGKAD